MLDGRLVRSLVIQAYWTKNYKKMQEVDEMDVFPNGIEDDHHFTFVLPLSLIVLTDQQMQSEGFPYSLQLEQYQHHQHTPGLGYTLISF